MTDYRLVAEPRVYLDVAATYQWYENEQPGLGLEFLDQLRAVYDRIAAGPFQYRTSDPESAARCFDAFTTSCTSRWTLMSSSYSPFCTRVGIRQSGSGDMTSV